MSHLKKRTLQTHPAISISENIIQWVLKQGFGARRCKKDTQRKTQRECNVCLTGEETKIEYFQNVL